MLIKVNVIHVFINKYSNWIQTKHIACDFSNEESLLQNKHEIRRDIYVIKGEKHEEEAWGFVLKY